MNAVADHYCPHPVKFRHVWSQKRGTPLTVWRPVPPGESFVSLAMVATTSGEPPPVDCVRCVPKCFCRPAKEAPEHLWNDLGAGGKAGSMWLVNNTQALYVALGHDRPHETFWELGAETVTFDYTGRASVHFHHEKAASKGDTPKGSKKGRLSFQLQ